MSRIGTPAIAAQPAGSSAFSFDVRRALEHRD